MTSDPQITSLEKRVRQLYLLKGLLALTVLFDSTALIAGNLATHNLMEAVENLILFEKNHGN
jgi:hypothetical protein